MFFVSKKKYNALLEQKKDFERIATNAVAQNGRLLQEWANAITEMKSIQDFNHRLVRDNDELLARVKELKSKLDFVTKQRDYYFDLLESTSDADEEGKVISSDKIV